jgi:ATP-dependent DNA helicase RecG
MLDYQERPAPKTEVRWLDRLTSDGEWSGNLFDFCRIVLKKLYKDLGVPFQTIGGVRTDDSPVHIALREALVNTLIHADFAGRISILIVKRPDLFGFRNPGCMRVPLEDALVGGNSDCRNRVLQRLFRMAGYAEQAGQGIPTIYSGWSKQLWRAPLLRDRRDGPEQTVLTLPLISLLSDETVTSLEKRFGSSYKRLGRTQQMALATVAVEGKVSHSRLKTMVYDHPSDITAALSSLCREGFLEPSGVTRGRFYFFPGESPVAEHGEQALFDSEDLPGSEQTGKGSVHLEQTSEHSSATSEHWPRLMDLAKAIRDKRKAPRERVEAVICEMCSGMYLTLKELEKLLGRSAESLRVHYLNRMAKEGRIKLKHPDALRHPSQAYTSASKP